MIEIDYPNEGKIYCPACGKLILDLGEAAIITDCPHVEFLISHPFSDPFVLDKTAHFRRKKRG